MRNFLLVLWAEAKKGHRLNFHSTLIYFSLLIWPAVMFVSAYYSYRPFNLGAESPLPRFFPPEEIGIFLLSGYLGYIFFWSLVQSAWQLSFERQSGTLELIFLTPVSRLGFIYGRAAADLGEGVWLFFTFSILAAFFMGGGQAIAWWSVLLALVILTLAAVIWGGFLNTVFLFSRDSGFLYTILDEPMVIFSGVKVPIEALPFWAKAISYIFPLTYVLRILRGIILTGASTQALLLFFVQLVLVLALMVVLTYWLLQKAEAHAKREGNMVLF